MKKTTDNLFYSSKEDILFWVAGYTRDGNTENVAEILKSLEENATKFAEQADIPFDKVLTFYNTQPPRYQYMRIFYTYTPKNIEGAFKLGENWTMYNWITT